MAVAAFLSISNFSVSLVPYSVLCPEFAVAVAALFAYELTALVVAWTGDLVSTFSILGESIVCYLYGDLEVAA